MENVIEFKLKTGRTCLIDEKNKDLLEKYNWLCTKYVVTHYNYFRSKPLSLHREIMKKKLQREILTNEYVDHINRNTFDNRECNLRLVDYSMNCQNRGKKLNA